MVTLARIWSEESHNLQREHQRSRRIGETHPGAYLPHAERVNPDEVCRSMAVSQPQGRPKSSAGEGRIEKRMLAVERQGEIITRRIGPLPSLKGR
jgi:hypothetical protein